MAEKPKVSFFKVLNGEHFMNKIKIPTTFVNNFKKILPNAPTLKPDEGKACTVLMVKKKDGYYLEDGWNEFAKTQDLKWADFLVFNLVNHSTYEVVIFAKSGCLKSCIPKVQQDQEPSKLEIKIKKRKENIKISPRSCKKARVSTQNKNDWKAERERVAERVRSLKPKNPFFVAYLKEYQLRFLAMPIEFAKKAGLVSDRSIGVKGPMGRELKVAVKVVKLRSGFQVQFSSGWGAVRKENKLSMGDICVFYLIAKQEGADRIEFEVFRKS